MVNDMTQILAGESIQKNMSLFDFQQLQLENVMDFCFIILNIHPL